MRRGRVLVGVAVIAASVVALGSVPAGTAGFAGPPLVPPPSSMATAGDSFTAGFANGAPCVPAGFNSCPTLSWATGTDVDSHYVRLLALNPALAGNTTVAATPGASMSAFAGQATTIGPFEPDYVTVLLGGGDVCFSTNTPATFATQFRAGMDALFAASPGTKVLVSSIWSFESLRAAVLDGNPAATFAFCTAFMNATAPDRAIITARLEAYNAALETECATYANCLFDGNALYDHVWTPAEVSTVDNFHPSAAGEEMISEVLYNAGYRWGIDPPTPADAIADVARFVG